MSNAQQPEDGAPLQGGVDASGFADRQFVVTGGAGGIGRACARDLLERGAHVLLVDVDAARLEQARSDIGGGDRLAVHVSLLASPAE